VSRQRSKIDLLVIIYESPDFLKVKKLFMAFSESIIAKKEFCLTSTK